MAKKLAGGSSKNTKDSAGKRRGVKKYGGEFVSSGAILVRQVGCKFKSFQNTRVGRDYTIYATKAGVVKFQTYKGRKVVSVI